MAALTATGGPSDDGKDGKSGREPMAWQEWMAQMRKRVRADIRLATAAVPDSLPPDDDAAPLALPASKHDGPDWTFTEAESKAIYALREKRDELLMLDRLLSPERIAFARWLIANGIIGEWETREG